MYHARSHYPWHEGVFSYKGNLMKTMRGWQWTALAAATLWASLAWAGGPEAAHIAADAKAYVHFDTALLRDSTLLKVFRTENGATNPLDKTLDAIQQMTGVHLLDDMDGVTFYTPTLKAGEGVLLIYGKVNQDELLRHLEMFPEHASQPYGEHQIHTWFDQQRNAVVAGMVSDKLLMWTDSVERMKDALDVLDAKKEGKYTLARDYPKGALFGAGVSDMPAFAQKPDQQIFTLAKSFGVSLTENKETVRAVITAGMADAEQAGQVKQVAEGLKAFMALNKAKMPEMAKLVNLVKTEAEGAQARVSLERPATTVFDDLKKIQAAMAGKGK